MSVNVSRRRADQRQREINGSLMHSTYEHFNQLFCLHCSNNSLSCQWPGAKWPLKHM